MPPSSAGLSLAYLKRLHVEFAFRLITRSVQAVSMVFCHFVGIIATALLCLATVSAKPERAALRPAKRNLGGPLKDWYLMKMTKNYFCTDTGRVIPVDPETGHMLLKGLRKRGSIDDFFHTSHATEHGICKDGESDREFLQ